jgi:hypothetical protein
VEIGARKETGVKSDAQRRTENGYRKKNVKQIVVRFYPTGDDGELYDWIKSHDNVTGYLKSLVRNDMDKAK